MKDQSIKGCSKWWLLMFVILFFCPMITWPIVSRFVVAENIENRNESKFPELTIDNYKLFSTELEKYFDDVLPYRDILIQTNSSISYYLFRESSENQVIVGTEEWLFYQPTLADYKKTNLYGGEQLKVLAERLENLKEILDKKDIEFFVFIAPNKASIYGENYLPAYIVRNDGLSKTEMLVEYLSEHTDINIIFPLKELKETVEENPEYPLYFHRDTHWNYLGGYVGAKALLEKIGKSLPMVEILKKEKINLPVFSWNGYDLANMMGLTNVLDTDINYNVNGYSDNVVRYEGDVPNDREAFNTFCRSYSNADDQRKVIFARDSFGTSMMPYLASCFGEIYSPHISQYIKLSDAMEDVENENPDIFIVEIVERSSLMSHFVE